MPCIDYGPNGTNTNERDSNRISKYSPRDEASEDVERKAEYYEKTCRGKRKRPFGVYWDY